MTKLETLKRKFKENPKSLKYRQLEKLLAHLGFTARRGKGTHIVFNHPQVDITFAISVHGTDCKPWYKKEALRILQAHNLI